MKKCARYKGLKIKRLHAWCVRVWNEQIYLFFKRVVVLYKATIGCSLLPPLMGDSHQEVGNSMEVVVSLWLINKPLSFHTNRKKHPSLVDREFCIAEDM